MSCTAEVLIHAHMCQLRLVIQLHAHLLLEVLPVLNQFSDSKMKNRLNKVFRTTQSEKEMECQYGSKTFFCCF